jgi:hypothetical protein
MDITFLVVTLFSLTAAAVSLVAARRIKHQDRHRSEARVAALAAASMDDLPVNPIRERPTTIRERQAAGVDRHPANISGRATLDSRPPAMPNRLFGIDDFKTDDEGVSANRDDRFFGTVQREASTSGRFAFVAAAALLVALGGAVVVFTTSGSSKNASVTTTATHSEPLELVSLGHLRDASSLTISGIVRNPASGPKVEGLTAVVSLIDAHGGLISTKDVPLDYRALGPGEEAPFKVSIPEPGAVARYRVSFRAGTEIVPHVDRRGGNKLASAL